MGERYLGETNNVLGDKMGRGEGQLSKKKREGRWDNGFSSEMGGILQIESMEQTCSLYAIIKDKLLPILHTHHHLQHQYNHWYHWQHHHNWGLFVQQGNIRNKLYKQQGIIRL